MPRRPRARITQVAALEKRLGSLPVIADFSRRLDLAGIIDRACPVRDVAAVGHGQVIEALIANRLTDPRPMVAVADRAQDRAVEEVYGIRADLLNDDRPARALDAIAPRPDHLLGSIGARAVREFGIDVTRIHWDMTSMSPRGSYDRVDEGHPAPAWGHPKDRRADLKQIQAGIAVTADGGTPVLHRAHDGNAGEVAQVVDTMEHLRAPANPRTFPLIGDSKLISHTNVTAMVGAQVTFIAPLAAARVPAGLSAGLDPAAVTEVGHTAERDRDVVWPHRRTYRVGEDVMDLAGPRERDPVHRPRRILVHSSADATGAAKARALKPAHAREDLDTLTRTAGTRHQPSVEAVNAKADQIAVRREVKFRLRTHVGVDPAGKPTFTWSFDQDALDAEAAGDGWYALSTNHGPDLDATEIFSRYKDQPTVERRYGEFKGPLAVAPIFLRNNRRITALTTVIRLALLIFCLIERQVRLALAPDTDMIGFHHNDRRAMKPTARLILRELDGLRLIPDQHDQPPTIPKPTWPQARLLHLLQVDPTQPRWP